MTKKVSVMGVELDNYPMRESLLILERYLNNKVMNTVQLVNMEYLIAMKDSETMRQALKQMDLTVIGDREILETSDRTLPQRLAELENHSFFMEFMKRMYRANHTVYIVGDDQGKIDLLKGFLQDNFEHIRIVGESVLEKDTPNYEKTVNDINIILPEIILSVISSPRQEEFLLEHKNQIFAKLWYGLGTEALRNRRSLRVRKIWRKLVGGRIFHHHVNKFEENN